MAKYRIADISQILESSPDEGGCGFPTTCQYVWKGGPYNNM